jgi:small-conductance mechanosensitive channel
LKSWQKETQSILDELSANLRNQILRMRDLRSSLTSVGKKAEASKDAPPELMEWIDKQRTHVEAAMRVHERNLGSIEDSRRVHEKLLDEIGQRVQTLSATLLAYGAWSQVEKVWGYELAKVEEDGLTRQITVGKIVTALLILLVGWVLARIVSALFANRLLKRFRLSKDAVAALRTLVFYALLIVVALVALRWVNVPLTAFTILGGALAIGVGFGSQALITNFIGGLIMLAERPVRLGERISFGSYDGVVEDVGFRCTKLRTSNDHLVTIPNSALVNDSIENMARSRMIRRLLNVTLTYDTPREKVAAAVQAIRDILDEKELREKIHPIVGFEEFPPRVHFNDFNAESLNIQVMYWYAPPESWAYLEHCERVNYRIMEAFERIGVEFAFPSRTLYLAGDPQRDLASRLLSNGNDPNRSAA